VGDPNDYLSYLNAGYGGGFGDFTNPDNPFKDWSYVWIPYCSCDVHWGDNGITYPPQLIFPEKHVEHRGYSNAKLVEKWAREHFVNPTDIFVTGGSAGSYGAMMHGIHLSEVYPASSISVLGDGGNGIIPQDWLVDRFANWGVPRDQRRADPAANNGEGHRGGRQPLPRNAICQLLDCL
jgi:hypothetical protein